MSEASVPVIPYEKQEDPQSNRMCGAACLAMVYRSLAGSGDGPSGRKRGRDRRSGGGRAPLGKERRAGRRRSEELTQAEIWPAISKPNRFGVVSSSTHLMVAHARSKGYSALAIQARYPLASLVACRSGGIRAVLNHRLRADSGAGHYSVLLDVDAEAVVLHDPFYGPGRRIPQAELLELWQPRTPVSEITGNVLIGIADAPPAESRCPVCRTPIPRSVSCPRCSRPVSLAPTALLGCVGAGTCLGRLWNYVCCPACDNMWNFAVPAPEAERGAPVEEGIWNLGPLFAELDAFLNKAMSVPGMAARADVKEQLAILEKCKVDLRLAEKEEAALARQREAQLSRTEERFGAEAAAAEKAREEAAKPSPAPDGGALGDALLKDLGITR